jgi:geranylgeranyl diphosphate synthase type II
VSVRAADVETAEAALADYGGRARTAMLDALPDGTPGPWLYDLLRRYPSRPSKGLRPTLFLATCEAFGGSAEAAMGVAVAIELLHNAFLVHDDIVDGSLQRRGSPTLHEDAGLGLALNAGDALGALAQRQLRLSVDHLSAGVASQVLEEFETMLIRTAEGQATELGWCRDGVDDVEPEDYLDLIMHKTCWYTTIHPLRVGALIGASSSVDGPRPDLDAMIRFGFHLGAAFQIRDDILNLTGDDRYGKEIGGDLLEGKRTLMLIHLRQHARGEDAEVVAEFLAGDRTTRSVADARRIRSLMDQYGSISFAEAFATGVAEQATTSFEAAFAPTLTRGPNPGATAVRSLITYMHGRRS